jgi:hypothetical protein
MVEHSCLPNAQISSILSSSSQPHLQIRATRKIELGEEITISYVDQTLTTEERQAKLMENKNFRCTCQRCQNESDPKSDNCLDAFLCTDCAKEKRTSLIGRKSRTCQSCQKEYQQKYFEEISGQLTKTLKRADTSSVGEAVGYVLKLSI